MVAAGEQLAERLTVEVGLLADWAVVRERRRGRLKLVAAHLRGENNKKLSPEQRSHFHQWFVEKGRHIRGLQRHNNLIRIL